MAKPVRQVVISEEIKTDKCNCGGEPLYDEDGCGHEWLTCDSCKFEIETYECRDGIENVWNRTQSERKGRRYLINNR